MTFNLEFDACKSRIKTLSDTQGSPLSAQSHTPFLRKLLKLYVLKKPKQEQNQERPETEKGKVDCNSQVDSKGSQMAEMQQAERAIQRMNTDRRLQVPG